MTNTTTSPNMNLPVPTVSEDPGPDWASNLNACLAAIDSHNHSSGQGVSITPDGININADFSLNNFNVTTTRSLRFTPQSGSITDPADLGCLYENGVDLYYVDGAGNQVRITQGGSVTGSSGTITGLPSGTASASFSAGTFTFQSATNTPAAMNFGPTTIGQNVVSGFGVTVSANASQASNYALSFPVALPASTKFATIDSSGNIGDSYDVDNSTLEVVASVIQVKDLGITNAKLAAANIATSSSSGSFTTTSATYVNVTNLSVTISTVGRPVMIFFNPPGATSSDIGFVGAGAAGSGSFRILRSGGAISTTVVSTTANNSLVPPGSLNFIDQPSAGSHTYVLQAQRNIASGSVVVDSVVMNVIEI